MAVPEVIKCPRAAVVVLAVALTVALLGAGTARRDASAQERSERISGASRAETAAQVAHEAFPNGAQTAVLARQGSFPDALAGSALAGSLDAPILLTKRNRLSEPTAVALDDLGVDEAVLLGGEQAISSSVAAELETLDYAVSRQAGGGRSETAATIARRLSASIETVDGERVAFVANGGRYPDALVAGPVAYESVAPILLAGGDTLPEVTGEALSAIAPDKVFLLGGRSVLSEQVAEAVHARGIATDRIAGADRTATAAAFADFALGVAGFDAQDVLVARGDGFADALAAAPLAGSTTAPILLSQNPARAGDPLLSWTSDHASTIVTVRAIGGAQAVSAGLLQQLTRAAAGQGRPPAVPADTDRVIVDRVVDGDTIKVRASGAGSLPAGTSTIRLLEIDTPETKHPTEPVQCWGPEASAFAKQRFSTGETIWLQADEENTGTYGRYLRYAWTDEGFYNHDAVYLGYAEAVLYEPNDRYINALRAAEADAHANDRGMWGPPCNADAEPTPEPTPEPTAPSGGNDCAAGYDPCVPPPPPDLDCGDLNGPYQVTGSDPHRLDGDGDGIGCES
jgi:micrococcal nuclease